MSVVTRAEVCVAACADAWRGDGELLASPFGMIPAIGARLARATFEPDLMLTDGEAAMAVAGTWALGGTPPTALEEWMPFRQILEICWAGQRHVMMAPTQLDRYGNANISRIGDAKRPKTQLLGPRGAPGNSVLHPTSYWVSRHSTRVMVPTVDMVCGVGYDRAAAGGPEAARFHDLRWIVTNLAVLDFGGEQHTMRLVSVHPGVSVDEVQASTGFPLEVSGEVAETRTPNDEELRLIRETIDPQGFRDRELAA